MSFIQIPIQIYPNTSLGYSSLSNLTSGSSNTAIGYESLKSVTSGFENVAVGNLSLRQITTGAGNTAVGNLAISTGSGINNSTAVGAEAMRLSLSGADNNTAIGNSALRNTLTGAQNTAVGYSAGYLISTGSKNTILGAYNGNQGGLDIRTLSNYVVISDGDGNPRIIVDPAGLVSAPGGFSGGGGGGALTFNNQTAAYTVVSGDLGKIVNCTANTFTVSLTAAATLGSGFNCWIWNTGTGTITIDPNGSETIDGVSTIVLRTGEGTQIICDGTNWQTGDKKTMRAYAEKTATGSSRPIASGGESVAIGFSSTSSGSNSFAAGGWATASGVASISIGGYLNAATASSNYSTALGNNSAGNASQAVTGAGAMSLGGSYASGTDSFAAAVANNTSTYGATGANSVAIGFRASASGTGSVNLGYNGTCSGSYSRNFGYESTSTGNYSTIINGTQASDNGIWGKCVIGSAIVGGGQKAFVQLRALTTDLTATILASNGAAAGATNQVILPNNSAYAFTGTVVARQQAAGGTQSAAWKIEGLIRREANAASTTLVTSTVTVISNVPGWTLSLSADTTNGGLAVTATGAAATSIKWLAVVESAEITYA